VCGSRELTHVQSDLGDEHLGGLDADAADPVQAIDRRQPARHRRLVGVLAGVVGLFRGGWAAGMEHPGQLRVVVVEAAGQRLHQGGALAAHSSSGQLGKHLGSRCPAISVSTMSDPRRP